LAVIVQDEAVDFADILVIGAVNRRALQVIRRQFRGFDRLVALAVNLGTVETGAVIVRHRLGRIVVVGGRGRGVVGRRGVVVHRGGGILRLRVRRVVRGSRLVGGGGAGIRCSRGIRILLGVRVSRRRG